MIAGTAKVRNTTYRPVPMSHPTPGPRPIPSQVTPLLESRALARIEVNTLTAPQPKPHISVTYVESGDVNHKKFAASLLLLAKRYLDNDDVYHMGGLQPHQQMVFDTAVVAAFRRFPFDIRQSSGTNIVDMHDSLRIDVNMGQGDNRYKESVSVRISTGWDEETEKYFLRTQFQDGIGQRTEPSRWTGALVNNINSIIYLTERELAGMLPKDKTSFLDRLIRLRFKV